VEGVRTRTCEAPASFASIQSFFVSRVDCAPVPAMTTTFLYPLSSRVFRVKEIACLRSSCDLEFGQTTRC
jgi:hypothetical protein